jgi:hypothetical protein
MLTNNDFTRFDNAVFIEDGTVLMIQDGKCYRFTAEEFRAAFGYSAELIFKKPEEN